MYGRALLSAGRKSDLSSASPTAPLGPGGTTPPGHRLQLLLLLWLFPSVVHGDGDGRAAVAGGFACGLLVYGVMHERTLRGHWRERRGGSSDRPISASPRQRSRLRAEGGKPHGVITERRTTCRARVNEVRSAGACAIRAASSGAVTGLVRRLVVGAVGCAVTFDPTRGGAVAEPVRVRRLTDQEGQKLQQIVRRGSTSSVLYRRAEVTPAVWTL